jgi:hypothetical protein
VAGDAPPSFHCPRCGQTSHNPLDVTNRYCGWCHIYIDQWLCIQVRVAGDIVDKCWFDAIEPGPQVAQVAVRHAAIVERADAAGLTWALEVYDPEADRTARLSNSDSSTSVPVDLTDYETYLHMVAKAFGWI